MDLLANGVRSAKRVYMENMEKQFIEFILKANPGDRFIYHIGDNLGSSIAGSYMGDVAREQYKKGHVLLHMKRAPDRRMQYIAVRTKKVYAQ